MIKLNKKQTKLKHNGFKYRAVQDNGNGCSGCAFQFTPCPSIPKGEDATCAYCAFTHRKDRQSIIWVKKEQAE